MYQELLAYSLSVFMGFFASMNPIANTPIFIGMTEGQTAEQKRKIAKTATVTAFIIVTIFVLMGKYIFEVFGITIQAFKITGGILIFYVGFEMLMSKQSEVQNTKSADEAKNLAISPLGIPILAGPGTIVTAMNNVTDASLIKTAIVIAIFGIMVCLTFSAFSLADLLVKKLGKNPIAVIGKLMGLILAIIGTDMIISGIKLAFNIG